MGLTEAIDRIVAALQTPMDAMGQLLTQIVTININGSNEIMPLSTAALTGFVMPWVNDLGQLLIAISDFLDIV
jgi:DUF917 family protein